MIRNIFWNLLKIGFLILPCVVQAQDRVAVDMGGDWLRRDWDDCGENVTGQHRDGVFAIRSEWHGVVG
ncbi:MAG: hypothetical protein F4Z86_08320 [Gemmatimonadetes bacterium]|nr:hypothetical protein [Gemmatimonadota bacterium]